MEVGGERWYEAELYRLNGALLLVSSVDAQAEAEACFNRAHSQGAPLFELRATTGLCHQKM